MRSFEGLAGRKRKEGTTTTKISETRPKQEGQGKEKKERERLFLLGNDLNGPFRVSLRYLFLTGLSIVFCGTVEKSRRREDGGGREKEREEERKRERGGGRNKFTEGEEVKKRAGQVNK